MGAEYLFYMKSIETHARTFLALIILGIGTVKNLKTDSVQWSIQPKIWNYVLGQWLFSLSSQSWDFRVILVAYVSWLSIF